MPDCESTFTRPTKPITKTAARAATVTYLFSILNIFSANYIMPPYLLYGMKIRVIAIGKPSPEYKKMINEYEKRLGKLLEVVEYKENAKEAATKGYIVALDNKGKQVSSEGLAELVEEHKEITFIIGGPDGLTTAMKKRADVMISFGNITLPHQLARLVLTEQIYRAVTIIRKEKYHK